MPQDKGKQTAIAPDTAWEEMVKNAKDLPEMHPKVRFGKGKLDEVSLDLVFEEEQPRFITFADPYNEGKEGKALAINVRVIAASGQNNPEAAGNVRALIMPSKQEHTLTRGILSVARKHGSKLKGCAVRIETRNYKHERYGDTRGFSVSEITPPSVATP